MLRVYVASHSAGIAGAELSLLEILRLLAQEGHDATLTLPERGPLSERLGPQWSGRIETVSTRRWMGPRQRGLRGLVRLCQSVFDTTRHLALIRAVEPDVVVVNTATIPAPLIAAKIAGVPSVLLLREVLVTNGFLRSAVPTRLLRWSLRALASTVIANSKYAASCFGLPAKVIYPQVTLQRGHIKCGRVGSAGNGLRLLMIGSVTPQKGQLDGIRAMQEAQRLGSNPQLDFIGWGEPSYIQRLRSEAGSASARVRFLGPVAVTESLINQYSATLVLAREEAFGRATIESLVMGCPVIGYRSGGTEEILSNGGGVLVDPSPERAAEAIVRLESDPQLLERLSQQALANPILDLVTSSARDVVQEIVGLAEPRPSS